jgi:lipoprotein-anchoring transpeptidase ErfK/SrfK
LNAKHSNGVKRMHNTLRNSALVLAAALALGAAGGCAAAGSVHAEPVAATADQPVTPDPGPAEAGDGTPALAAPPAAAPPAAAPSADPPSDAARDGDVADAGVPCQAAAVACVSLSRQEAWLLRGGEVVYGPVQVATGREGLPTPAGIFQVKYKVRDSWSAPYQSWMPWAVYFYGGDAFHEDPVDVRSHGCIHLSAANAEYFYNFLKVGDEVQVTS